jgi:hypothetical protein
VARGFLTRPQQLLYGAIGAAAPYLLRLAATGELPVSSNLGLVVGVLVLIALVAIAAVWAMALHSHSEFLAMYHGATFPIVFSFLAEVSTHRLAGTGSP